MKITSENFGEYERKVWRMECKRGKALAAQRAGGIVGGIASIPVAIIATLYFLCLPEGPTIEELEKAHLLWLRPPVLLWEKLCRIILPEGSSTWTHILFSMVAVVLAALAFHILVALIVGLVYPKAPFIPLEGSDAKKANNLRQRCKEAGSSLSSLFIIRICPRICYFLLWIILFFPELPGIIEKFGLIVGLFLFAVLDALLLAAYSVPYFVYQKLSGFLGHIRPDEQLEKALEEYAASCEHREQERKQAEEAEKKRKQAEEERKKSEENRKRGDELFQQATAQTSANEDLIKKAADLGCRPACLHMGRNLTEAFGSDSYTKTEKEEIAKTAKDYLKIASMEENDEATQVEAWFLLLSLQAMTESGTLSKWQGMLSQLRHIRDSGKLPEHLLPTCAQLIDIVVAQVNLTEEKEKAAKVRTVQAKPRSSGTPPVKRVYCKFFNAGICNYSSSSSSICHCTHVSNPGDCWTALNNKGLGFEFYD